MAGHRSGDAPGGAGPGVSQLDERSNCGVGVVMDLDGGRDHWVVADGLELLENLEHRGTTGAEENTGDGAGIKLQIPHEFFADEVDAELPDPGAYAVGTIFFPQDDSARAELQTLVEEQLATEGLDVLAWREVPTVNGDLGATALESEPAVCQVFVESSLGNTGEQLSRQLYVGRRAVENGIESLAGDQEGVERFYFVGYSLFTMGNGDFTPKDGIWQIVTSLTTASGMLFVTLIVSYVISVLEAVTQKRAFASNVSGLGQRGETIVRSAWNGETFDGLELPLNSFTTEINELTTNHQAYPILHYFYTDQRKYATVLSIVALDEALTLLRFGVSEDERPSKAILENARASVGNYLQLVTSSFGHTAVEEPPAPDLDIVREAGVPTVSDEAFSQSLTEAEKRRKRLLGLVEADARAWPLSEDD